ncbi:hypothetical protein E2C01_076820 [Portunus trituberculatus]|uniref:Uncharacterized protein n=1 Tax=Portunus trituberculatus TaxID=210409 RepID=A0A5B7IIM9_PORTR|nr:hypothetical protein [Portunus trituberculatus]
MSTKEQTHVVVGSCSVLASSKEKGGVRAELGLAGTWCLMVLLGKVFSVVVVMVAVPSQGLKTG